MNELEIIENLFELYSSFSELLYSYLNSFNPELKSIIIDEINSFNGEYNNLGIVFENSKIKFFVKKVMKDKSITFFTNKNMILDALNKFLNEIYEKIKEKVGVQKRDEMILSVCTTFENDNIMKVKRIENTDEVSLFSFMPDWIKNNLKKSGFEENIEFFFN